VLRGAKTMTGMKDLNPIQNRVPALQYLDSVEAGSVADRAGLQPGDFILAVSFFLFARSIFKSNSSIFLFSLTKINGEDLAKASHETVVDCIRRSGNLVQLTICSATVLAVNQSVSQSVTEYALTVPNSSRQYSTLPRKLPGSVLCNTEIVVSLDDVFIDFSFYRASPSTTETRSQNDAKCGPRSCSFNGCSTQ
jgi:SH3/ankyrin repeat-containing protein